MSKGIRKSKRVASDEPQVEAAQVVTLPDLFSKNGELHAHLVAVASQVKGDDDLEREVSTLQEAFMRFRKECNERLQSKQPSHALLNGVCADMLNVCLSDEAGVKRFFRLVVVMMLADEPDPNLLNSGVESYMTNPEMMERLLGPVIPSRLRKTAAARCYLENTHHTGASDWVVFRERMLLQREQPLPGMATGLLSFDESTGGLSDLMILAGAAGSGKTCLAQQLAIGALKEDSEVGVIYIDTELGKDSLYRRLLSREAKVEQRRLFPRDQTDSEARQVDEAERLIKASILPRYVIEAVDMRRPPQITFKWFTNLVMRWSDRWKTNKIVLVVDSVQKLPVGLTHPQESEYEAITRQRLTEGEQARMRIELLLQVQRASRSMLPPGGLPILVTSRIRKPTSTGRLELADVLGGVDNVFDAAAVFLLETSGEQRADGTVASILNVAKIRDYGSCGDLRLDFDFKLLMFREVGRPAPKIVGPRQGKPTRFSGKS